MANDNPLFVRLIKSPKLPSVPAVAIRLLDLVQDPDVNPKTIVDTIKADPALTVKILKSANSAYFSFRAEIKTIEQAIPLIGRTSITALALSFTLANEAITDPLLSKHYRRYWLQSLVQAAAAESLAKTLGAALSSELFMTSLLLDLGQLALLKVYGKEYLPFLDSADSSGEPLDQLEKRTLGFSHIDVGTHLMADWKLPDALVRATEFHHSSADALALAAASEPLVLASAMAATVGDYFCSPHSGPALLRLKDFGARFFKFDQRALSNYLEKVEVRVKQAGDLLQTSTDELLSASDLMAQACDQLAQISIAQEQQSREVVVKQHQTEMEKLVLETQNEQLRQQVFRDPLTGVYNRRFFDEVLATNKRQSSRSGDMIAVLFIDADHFKRVNDNFGHKVGDQVLVQIARVLEVCIRDSDIVARYGGEEFVIMATQTTEPGVKVLAERIRSTIESQSIQFADKVLSVTVSIGAALAYPQRGDENFVTRLVETADAAMYESKRRGRNRVTIQSLATEFERQLSRLTQQFRFSNWLIERKVVDAALMHDLTQTTRPKSTHLGEMALRRHWLTLKDVEQLLASQEQTGERIGGIAYRLNLLSDRQLACLLADQLEQSDVVAKNMVLQGVMSETESQALLDSFLSERDSLVMATHNHNPVVQAAH